MVIDKLHYSAAPSFAEPNWPVCLFMEPDQCVCIFPCRFWAAVSARSGETVPISADWEPELQHPGSRCWGLAEPQCRTVDCEWQGWGGSTHKHWSYVNKCYKCYVINVPATCGKRWMFQLDSSFQFFINSLQSDGLRDFSGVDCLSDFSRKWNILTKKSSFCYF